MLRILTLAATVALLACSASAPSATARFERNLGSGSGADIYEQGMRFVREHQFEVEQAEREPTVLIMSEWRSRVPFDDEQALGVSAAQNRIVIRARPRSQTPKGPIYSADLRIDNRVRLGESTEWTDGAVTPMYRKWADQLTEDLKEKLAIGVRRY